MTESELVIIGQITDQICPICDCFIAAVSVRSYIWDGHFYCCERRVAVTHVQYVITELELPV